MNERKENNSLSNYLASKEISNQHRISNLDFTRLFRDNAEVFSWDDLDDLSQIKKHMVPLKKVRRR